MLSIVLLSYSCYGQTSGPDEISIVPQPVSLQRGSGYFQLDSHTRIVNASADPACKDLSNMLLKLLDTPTGLNIQTAAKSSAGSGEIRLILNKSPEKEIGDEGYSLQVTTSAITITANKPKGLFYGVQTLMQLLPPDIESAEKVNGVQWRVPCVNILDYPRFGWRGLMLDVSRHFFSKEFVEAYIDEMAKYKFDVFHWHLTDDNGWRIEIKGLPALTQIGAWRVPRTGRFGQFEAPQPGEKATYGGYYTQDDIREVVKYAQERYITIVPEVDVPAHSLALIAAYPNLSCTQQQYPVNPGSDFYQKMDNALCVGNDSTYLILDKVFTQIAALFPGPYSHVGGDEAYKGFWKDCPKDQKVMADNHLKSLEELQSYFEKKIEKIILSKGKKMIGWDEILEGGLAPEATVMSWRGIDGGIKAAKMNHHVVMSPWGSTYIDLYQGDPIVEPATYGMLRLRTCYDFDPVPDGVDPQYILGGQANLWTESVPNERHAEYMTWPRALAISEAVWSPKDKRDWNGFIPRMEKQFQRLDAAHIKYARSAYDAIITSVKGSDDSLQVKLATEIPDLQIYYRFDGTDPDVYSPQYKGSPLDIPKGASQIRVITYRDGKPVGRQINFPLSELKDRLEKK